MVHGVCAAGLRGDGALTHGGVTSAKRLRLVDSFLHALQKSRRLTDQVGLGRAQRWQAQEAGDIPERVGLSTKEHAGAARGRGAVDGARRVVEANEQLGQIRGSRSAQRRLACP